MSIFPRKPAKGQKVLQALYDSICQIIDYLPSLEVRGDGKTTMVKHSSFGTTITTINNATNKPQKKGGQGGQYLADEISLHLNGQVFSIKPPADTSKNYALCWINGTYQWVQLGTCN